jgi:hypothetical protein
MTPDEFASFLTLASAGVFFGGRHRHWYLADATRGETTMQPAILSSPTNDDAFDPMPELPSPRQRWTVRRKAAVIEAVRGGWVPIEEICELYNISVDEFLAWERDIDRHGMHGLRTTRYQIYRDTDTQPG